MPNPEHLQRLQQGVEAWNQWREQNDDITPNLREANIYQAPLRGADLNEAELIEANLGGADLAEARLWRADLSGADLREADLRRAVLEDANLVAANLRGADLSGADLSGANLSGADLREADLREADLYCAKLIGANLTEASVFEVILEDTVFGDANLTAVRGLETCLHEGPSILDYSTLAKSGPLPLVFLRGCGLNDWEIETTKLYQSDLTATQINEIIYRMYALRADPVIQFYKCFISYASQDQTFVNRLYEDLQTKGVRCWCALEDMKTGDHIRDTIERQIRLREKMLVVLSSASIASPWVEDEVEAALEEERKSRGRRTVLVPIRIDNAVEETDRAWARTIKRRRHIGDFTHWEDNDAYQKALARLLQALNIVEKKLEG
jgi:hypothetical protein